VSETGTAFSVGSTKNKAVGLSTESDSAFAVTVAGLGGAVGLSSEVDSALSVVVDKGLPTSLQVIETDSVLALTPVKERDAVKGVVIDESLTAIVGISPILNLVTETDSAHAQTVSKYQPVNPAIEVDSVNQLSFGTVFFVGLPEEVDSAGVVVPFAIGQLGRPIEIDVSLPAAALRATLVGLASEVASTFSVGISTVLVPRDLGWEDDDVTWGGVEIGSKDFAPVYLTGGDFKILGYDASSPLDAYIERRAAISERGAIILGTAIWPDIVGPTGQAIQISLGSHNSPDGSIDWEGPYDFYIGQDEFLDFAVSGKYLATRFEGTGVSAWALQSYDLDYEIVGRH
jgi:hypothetical protein